MLVMLPAGSTAPAGFTYIGVSTQVIHLGHDAGSRDHDDEKERKNGRDLIVKVDVYRKN